MRDFSESKDLLPMQVTTILGHELIHAAVGVAAGHGKLAYAPAAPAARRESNRDTQLHR